MMIVNISTSAEATKRGQKRQQESPKETSKKAKTNVQLRDGPGTSTDDFRADEETGTSTEVTYSRSAPSSTTSTCSHDVSKKLSQIIEFHHGSNCFHHLSLSHLMKAEISELRGPKRTQQPCFGGNYFHFISFQLFDQ